MMARPPAIDFEFFQPDSLRSFPHEAQTRAIRHELDRRRRANAAKVRAEEMKPDAAGDDEAKWGELLDDFTDEAGGIVPRRRYRFTWAEKTNALRGEIMRRRRNFPRLVEQGRLSPDEAAEGIAVMECAQRWYWQEGLSFGAEFIVSGDAPATMDRLREEEARRHAWEVTGGDADKLFIIGLRVDQQPTLSARHIGPGPFTVRFDRDRATGDWLPANVLNAAGDGLFGTAARIAPAIAALPADIRAHALLAICADLNRQEEERRQPSLFTDAPKEAA